MVQLPLSFGPSPKKRVHQHSTASIAGERPHLPSREERIVEWLKDHGPSTDRQIRDGLELTDMNQVRPRITELILAGKISPLDEVIDEKTNKIVRRVRAL